MNEGALLREERFTLCCRAFPIAEQAPAMLHRDAARAVSIHTKFG